MKAVLISLILLLCHSVAHAEAETAESEVLPEVTPESAVVPTVESEESLIQIWDRANTAYVNGDYNRAIATYDSILVAGYSGKKLYYNLGNSYFKKQMIGKSILNYNRALLLDPSDTDVKHNLMIANNYVKDNIDKLPEFFVTTWMRAWRSSLSSNAWAATSLALLAVTLGAVLVYLLSGRLVLRKTGFYVALLGVFLTVCSIVFAASEKRKQLSTNDAIIMLSSAPVKSSPDKSSKDIFILHEGTKVDIVSSLGEWCEIVIADGKKGWILETSVETIRREGDV